MEEKLLTSENIRYNEIKNTIKIWPYLDDTSQAVLPYTLKYLSKDANMAVNIDLSNVSRINSSIAAIALKKLVSLVISEKTRRYFKIIMPDNEEVLSFMQNTGFLKILDYYFHFDNYWGDLFDTDQAHIQNETYNVIENIFGIKKTSFPIFHLKYNKKKERESVNAFCEWFDDEVLSLLDKYNVKTDALFSVITEIAKNSLDHTGNDAFCGVDLLENLDNNIGELIFSFSDLGGGISQKIRRYLKENPQRDLRADIWKHGSLTDMYKWAFTVGNTTSKKITNKGIGMTMIIEGANNLNMDLSFFDAKSMMQISKSDYKYTYEQDGYSKNSLSHEELRKKSWNTGNQVGFYYYGRLRF